MELSPRFFCSICFCAIVFCGIAYGLNDSMQLPCDVAIQDNCSPNPTIHIEKYDVLCSEQFNDWKIRALIKRVAAEYRDELGTSGERILEVCRNNLYILYCKKSDSPLVPMGFVAFQKEVNGTENMSGYINYFGIDKPFQHIGLGKILLDYAMNMLEAQGVCNVSLMVFDRNYKARNLYHKFGFIEAVDNMVPQGRYIVMQTIIGTKKR